MPGSDESKGAASGAVERRIVRHLGKRDEREADDGEEAPVVPVVVDEGLVDLETRTVGGVAVAGDDERVGRVLTGLEAPNDAIAADVHGAPRVSAAEEQEVVLSVAHQLGAARRGRHRECRARPVVGVVALARAHVDDAGVGAGIEGE